MGHIPPAILKLGFVNIFITLSNNYKVMYTYKNTKKIALGMRES